MFSDLNYIFSLEKENPMSHKYYIRNIYYIKNIFLLEK